MSSIERDFGSQFLKENSKVTDSGLRKVLEKLLAVSLARGASNPNDADFARKRDSIIDEVIQAEELFKGSNNPHVNKAFVISELNKSVDLL